MVNGCWLVVGACCFFLSLLCLLVDCWFVVMMVVSIVGCLLFV